MEIKGYCIPSVDSLKSEQLDFVQLTLNGRIYPEKRNYGNLLKGLEYKPNLFLHCDFIYTMSRATVLSDQTRGFVIKELVELSKFANSPDNINSNFKGIVMHIDFPLRKEVYSNPSDLLIDKYYSKKIYSLERVKRVLNDDWETTLVETLKEVQDRVGPSSKFKIYLENSPRFKGVPEGTSG